MPLSKVPSQAGGAVVCPQLDEGVEKVPVQVGELLSRADLFEVVRGNNEQIAQGVKCVKQLEHQWNLFTRKRKIIYMARC